jgi:phosphoenolpyruvate carboxykinase (GTP)
VLKWIFERCDGKAEAVDTPIGKVPAEGAIDVKGVKVDPTDMKEMTTVDKEGWKAEIPMIKEHFATFGAKMPQALKDELAALEKRLG